MTDRKKLQISLSIIAACSVLLVSCTRTLEHAKTTTCAMEVILDAGLTSTTNPCVMVRTGTRGQPLQEILLIEGLDSAHAEFLDDEILKITALGVPGRMTFDFRMIVNSAQAELHRYLIGMHSPPLLPKNWSNANLIVGGHKFHIFTDSSAAFVIFLHENSGYMWPEPVLFQGARGLNATARDSTETPSLAVTVTWPDTLGSSRFILFPSDHQMDSLVFVKPPYPTDS